MVPFPLLVPHPLSVAHVSVWEMGIHRAPAAGTRVRDWATGTCRVWFLLYPRVVSLCGRWGLLRGSGGLAAPRALEVVRLRSAAAGPLEFSAMGGPPLLRRQVWVSSPLCRSIFQIFVDISCLLSSPPWCPRSCLWHCSFPVVLMRSRVGAEMNLPGFELASRCLSRSSSLGVFPVSPFFREEPTSPPGSRITCTPFLRSIPEHLHC